MRIRTRILALVIGAILPALLMAPVGIGYFYSESQKENRRNLMETTRALTLLLDNNLGMRESALQALAASPSLDRADFAGFYEHARSIADVYNVHVALTDLRYRQILNTSLPFGTKDIPSNPAIAELRQKLGPEATLVSDMYPSQRQNSRRFLVQIPVKRDKRLLYYLSMSADVHSIQSLLEQQRLPEGWVASVIDRNGIILARTSDPEKFIGKSASPDFFRKVKALGEGTNEGPNLEGDVVYASFSQAPMAEWTFIVSVPKGELVATAVRATALISVLAIVLLAAGVTVSLEAGRDIARLIEALRFSAERLGRGEPVETESSGIAEIDQVNAAMLLAGQAISSASEDLKRKVAEAVSASEQSQRALLQSQRLESLGRLTGGIAHDFNNVLQTLTSSMQLIQLSASEQRVHASVEVCRRAIRRAGELTRKLMAFGRVQEAHLQTVSIVEQLKAVMPMLKGGLRNDIVLQMDIAPVLHAVTMDTLQFELALLNIAINAQDAMPEGGVLSISARNVAVDDSRHDLSAGDYVVIRIVDTGEGMTPEVLARAVDPFFTTKEVGKGSGMGLAQAYGFASQAGGMLALGSQPNIGTEVSIYLPRATAPLTLRRMESASLSASGMSASLLFVEDDALVCESVQQVLQQAGFDVVAAANADEALTLLESERHFDLVFSDIVMPGGTSGIQLAEIVRQRYPRLRMVLATGYTERRVSVPGVRIIAKPYSIADLVDALNDDTRAELSSA